MRDRRASALGGSTSRWRLLLALLALLADGIAQEAAAQSRDAPLVFLKGETCAAARLPHEHDKASVHDTAEECVQHCQQFEDAGAAVYHSKGTGTRLSNWALSLREICPAAPHQLTRVTVRRADATVNKRLCSCRTTACGRVANRMVQPARMSGETGGKLTTGCARGFLCCLGRKMEEGIQR
jgi:hypothetical protein